MDKINPHTVSLPLSCLTLCTLFSVVVNSIHHFRTSAAHHVCNGITPAHIHATVRVGFAVKTSWADVWCGESELFMRVSNNYK